MSDACGESGTHAHGLVESLDPVRSSTGVRACAYSYSLSGACASSAFVHPRPVAN